MQQLLTEIAWSELPWAEPFITIPACVLHFLEFLWFEVFQMIKFLCEGA